jgi:hypothetical protein
MNKNCWHATIFYNGNDNDDDNDDDNDNDNNMLFIARRVISHGEESKKSSLSRLLLNWRANRNLKIPIDGQIPGALGLVCRKTQKWCSF